MKKAHVFKYSQVILTDRKAAILEFYKSSGLNPQIIADIAVNEEQIREEESGQKTEGIIYQYKIGKINTEEFRKGMNDLIKSSGGTPITDDKAFDKCWNAMCIVEPEKLTNLH